MNFKRYKIYTTKKISALIYNLRKIFNFSYFSRYNFIQIFKFGKFNLDFIKKIKIKKNNVLFIHLPLSIIFFAFIYLAIPILYDYKETNIEKKICKNKDIECLIKGKISYRFYPTPRIKIKNIEVVEANNKKNILIKAEEIIIKLSFKNLLVKDKHKFKKIEVKKYEINLDLKNLEKYQSAIVKKKTFLPIKFKKGKITFYDTNDYAASIKNANANFIYKNDLLKINIKGNTFDESIHINLNSEKIENEQITNISLKMPSLDFAIKSEILKNEKDKNITNGNILIKKNDNKIGAIFIFEDNKINIIKSNIGNSFISGNLKGEIILLPFFIFNLDADLNSVNFKRLYNSFLFLEENKKNDLFKINKKVKGK